MVQWYREKTFCFKLKDSTETIKQTIWSDFQFKGQQISDYSLDGKTPLKFPLKPKDSIRSVVGDLVKVEDCANMSKNDFKALFPKLSLTISFVRPVIVGGLEYNYEFKKSVNDQIRNLITLTGGVPTGYLMQTFYANETPTKMYQIKPVPEQDAKNWEKMFLKETAVPGQAPRAPNKAQVVDDIEIDGAPVRDETAEFEQAFLDKIKAMPNKLDESSFIKAFLATAAKNGKIPMYTNKGLKIDERAKELFKRY